MRHWEFLPPEEEEIWGSNTQPKHAIVSPMLPRGEQKR